MIHIFGDIRQILNLDFGSFAKNQLLFMSCWSIVSTISFNFEILDNIRDTMFPFLFPFFYLEFSHLSMYFVEP